MRRYTDRVLVWTTGIATGLAYISGLLFMLLAFYMTADVVSRNLGGPFTGVADQFASFALALGGTWALARALADGTHVRIDVFMPFYGERTKSVLYLWSMLMVLVFALVLSWQAWAMMRKSIARNALVPQSMIDIPLALPQGLAAFGYSMFAFQSAVMLVAGLAILLNGQDELQGRLEGGRAGESI